MSYGRNMPVRSDNSNNTSPLCTGKGLTKKGDKFIPPQFPSSPLLPPETSCLEQHSADCEPFPSLHALGDEVEAPPTPPHRVLTTKDAPPHHLSQNEGSYAEEKDDDDVAHKSTHENEVQLVLEEQFGLQSTSNGSDNSAPSAFCLDEPAKDCEQQADGEHRQDWMRTPPAAELPYARHLLPTTSTPSSSPNQGKRSEPYQNQSEVEDDTLGMERLDTVATETKKKKRESKKAAGEEDVDEEGAATHQRHSGLVLTRSGGQLGSRDEDFWYDEQEPQPLLTRCRRCHSDPKQQQQQSGAGCSSSTTTFTSVDLTTTTTATATTTIGRCPTCDHHHHHSHRRSHSISSAASSSSSCITLTGEVPAPPELKGGEHYYYDSEDELDKEKRRNRRAAVSGADDHDLDEIRPFVPSPHAAAFNAGSSTTTAGPRSETPARRLSSMIPTPAGSPAREEYRNKSAAGVVKKVVIRQHDPYAFNVIGNDGGIVDIKDQAPTGKEQQQQLQQPTTGFPQRRRVVHQQQQQQPQFYDPTSPTASRDHFYVPPHPSDCRTTQMQSHMKVMTVEPQQQRLFDHHYHQYHHQQPTVSSYIPADQWVFDQTLRIQDVGPLSQAQVAKSSRRTISTNTTTTRQKKQVQTSASSSQQPATVSKRQQQKAKKEGAARIDDGWGNILSNKTPSASDALPKERSSLKQRAMGESLHGAVLAKHEGSCLEFVPYPTDPFPLSKPPTSSSQEDQEAAKEGHAEEEEGTSSVPHPSLKRVFIGQLPYECTEMQLSWLAHTFGGGAHLYHFERIKKIDRTHFRRCVMKQKKQRLEQQQQRQQEEEEEADQADAGEVPNSDSAVNNCQVRGHQHEVIVPHFQPTGCFHCYTDDDEMLEKMIAGLHRKVLVDDTGIWVVRGGSPALTASSTCKTGHQRLKNQQQQQQLEKNLIRHGTDGEVVLRDYCDLMKKDKSKRFQGRPYGTVVVQAAVSKFDPSAIPSSSQTASVEETEGVQGS